MAGEWHRDLTLPIPLGVCFGDLLETPTKWMIMCHQTTCRACKKATWAGCGQHQQQVMRGIPKNERREGRGEGQWILRTHLWWLSGRSLARHSALDQIAFRKTLTPLIALVKESTR